MQYIGKFSGKSENVTPNPSINSRVALWLIPVMPFTISVYMIQGQNTISSFLLAHIQSLTSVCNKSRRAEIQRIHLFPNMGIAFSRK